MTLTIPIRESSVMPMMAFDIFYLHNGMRGSAVHFMNVGNNHPVRKRHIPCAIIDIFRVYW